MIKIRRSFLLFNYVLLTCHLEYGKPKVSIVLLCGRWINNTKVYGIVFTCDTHGRRCSQITACVKWFRVWRIKFYISHITSYTYSVYFPGQTTTRYYGRQLHYGCFMVVLWTTGFQCHMEYGCSMVYRISM